MGMTTVAIDGESIFTWDGDEAAVKHVLEDFPHGAASVGMTPRALADDCVAHLSKGLRVGDEEQGQVGQEMQMVGVIWRILEAETHNAEHPGKIARLCRRRGLSCRSSNYRPGLHGPRDGTQQVRRVIHTDPCRMTPQAAPASPSPSGSSPVLAWR
jgi:hypothetical protein